MVIGLGYGLSLGLISPHLLTAKAHRGAYTLHTGCCGSGTQTGYRTPLDRALAPHGVSGCAGSHLGSTLKPGRAVLTLGVFRRSRSVAYIHADASPSEVLASAIVPPWARLVKLAHGNDCRRRARNGACGKFTVSSASLKRRTSFVVAVGRSRRTQPGLSCGPGSRHGGRPRRVRRQLRRRTPIMAGWKITP
jgi:hypothetical protein